MIFTKKKIFEQFVNALFIRQESETVVQLKGLLSSGKLPQGILAGGKPALQECKLKTMIMTWNSVLLTFLIIIKTGELMINL